MTAAGQVNGSEISESTEARSEGKLPLLERVVLGWRLGIGSEPVSIEGIAAHLGLPTREIDAIERRARILAADRCT